jgi:hypothetical protein
MAFQASDGKHFAHDGMGKSYEGTLGKGGKPGMDKGRNEGQEEQGEENPVAQHGPAHTTVIAKDSTGDHTVTSHHKDGHTHLSKGHDLHGAHEHSKKMFGESSQQPGEASDMSSLDNESAAALPQA